MHMNRGSATLKEPRAEWFPHGRRAAEARLRRVVPAVRAAIYGQRAPSVTEIARRSRSPFKVLVSTVISARTKDEVTTEAARRLFAKASTALALSALTAKQIEDLIYPAGFFRTKAKAIRALSAKIAREHGGCVPNTMEGLLALPGVGRKTANLVLTLGFALPGICVDTHVHRVVNRLGIIRTAHPAETEASLRAALPKRYWLEINDLLGTFGKTICAPVSPRCSICPLRRECARAGVGRSR
jgi:endonuclease-3